MRKAGTVWGIGLSLIISWSQPYIALNYGAGAGDCEIDFDLNGLADGWDVYHSWGTNPLSAVGVSTALVRDRFFNGQRAQYVEVNRASGTAGTINFQLLLINSSSLPAVLPPDGTPLRIGISLQTENLRGINVRIEIHSGDQVFLLASSVPANTQGWQRFSQIVPLARNASGEPLMRIVVRLQIREGSASGRLWIDAVECSWLQFPQPNRPRPNPLKIAHINVPPEHWSNLIAVPSDLVVQPIQTVYALKTFLPDRIFAIYLNAAHTTTRLPTPITDLYGGYDFVFNNHPNWLQRDSNGNPLFNPGYPDHAIIDWGLSEVQQFAISRLQNLYQIIPLPEWLFFDNAGSYWQSQQYPTRSQAYEAWSDYFQTVFSFVRNSLRKKIIINAGAGAGNYVDSNPGTQWLNYIDAVNLEHVITYYSSSSGYAYRPYRFNRSTLPPTDPSWWATLRALQENPNKVWSLMAMSDLSDTAMIRYIVASYFIMQNGRTYLMIEDRRTAGPHTYPGFVSRPELWIPLGEAQGNWRVVAGTATDASGALFARDYQYGIVLVNPTENQTYTYTLLRSYKNWDGQVLPAGTVLTIGPKKGEVLYAAPEIVVSLLPAQTTVMPGEAITLTVRYENRGLADATNVKISVPLPEGMTFVSGSAGAVVEGNTVSWVISRIRAGESGTKTLQVRVQ